MLDGAVARGAGGTKFYIAGTEGGRRRQEEPTTIDQNLIGPWSCNMQAEEAMIRHHAVRLALGMALTGCSVVWATSPSSPNYALPSSTLNSGVGDMISASYKMSSSLGDPFFARPMTSGSYQLFAGFWGTVIGPIPLCLLDLDGNGTVDAQTDGLMLLRVMFGLAGSAVTAGATAPGAPRTTWAAIQPMIHLNTLDIDGNGTTDALTDGLLLARAMSGLTGTAVTTGAVVAGAPRATWADVRSYLNARCGTNFAQ